MVVHDPEGHTTISAFLNTRRNFSAQGRVSFQYPVLNAGCPQQVWSRGKSTSQPIRRRTFTVSIATSGSSWSTKQGTKSDTFRRMVINLSQENLFRFAKQLYTFCTPECRS